LNGGPGSSSLIGFFTENGPFMVNDDSFGPGGNNTVPTLFRNPWAWSRIASVLYLESPAGVGFSYCDEEADCFFDDWKTASDNHDALIQFFTEFPEFSTQPFYITGESYAGIYIPTLVLSIMNDTANKINLQGLAIGDGCIGDAVGSCGPLGSQILAEFMFGHGMFSQTLWSEIQAVCDDWANPNTMCSALLNRMNNQFGPFDIYNIYDECGNDQFGRSHFRDYFKMGYDGNLRVFPHQQRGVTLPSGFEAIRRMADTNYGGALNDYKCGAGRAMSAYLALASVQEAIHVLTNVPMFSFNYTSTVTSLLPYYNSIISQYQVLIYSGDVDGCVPYVGTEQWVRGLDIPEKTEWHPWMIDDGTLVGDIVAGYATAYELNNFYFVTVKGAGHMVPQFKSHAAFSMFSKFLKNEPF